MAKRRASRRSKSSGDRVSGKPLGVKIISVLAYVLSAALLVMSIFLFGAGALLSTDDAQALIRSFVEDSTASTTIAGDVSLGIVVGGIIFLISAVLMFFVGRGLWNGKRWARVLMIVITAIGFVGALADILRGQFVGNIADLIINGWIAGYLLFNKRVQASFK